MSTNNSGANKEIEESMDLASLGSEDAAKRFFHAFLKGPLYVPDRYQSEPMANSPDYPSDFVSVLGIQDRDRAIVPVFTDPAYIQEWCGKPLTYREVDGPQLLKLMPEEWWLCINPGSEVEKEVSPWEIDILRGGSDGIPAVLEELFPRESMETLEVRPVRDSEYTSLKQKLREDAGTHTEIRKLLLLLEVGRDADDQTLNTVLLGVQIESSLAGGTTLEETRQRVRSVAEMALIGSGDIVKVFVGADIEDNLMLGVFRKEQPFYERPFSLQSPSRISSFLEALGRAFRGWRRDR